MTCKICCGELKEALDLGETFLANSLGDVHNLHTKKYPLRLCFCEKCKNLQLDYFVDTEVLYRNYLYITPNSTLLNSHYKFLIKTLFDQKYLTAESRVAEIGSNAGQFLRVLSENVNFAIGVEPASNIVQMTQNEGLNVYNDFFTVDTATQIKREHGSLDCVIARHCFAHNEFPGEMISAANLLLSENGIMVIENAYALNTVINCEFDQIYHEHMYYYSLSSLNQLFSNYDYELIDATIGEIHGGSIIAVAARKGAMKKSKSLSDYVKLEEISLDLQSILNFKQKSHDTINKLKAFIKHLKSSGNKIYSYGATAKGNTLLNTLEICNAEIEVCVDSTELKHGRYLPGSNIPIVSEAYGEKNPPDYYLLTAWNYKSEIVNKVRSSGNYKTRFIVPFPSIHIV